MSASIVVVICQLRRKEMPPSCDSEDEAYELWIIFEVRPAGQEKTDPELVFQAVRGAKIPERPNEPVKEAVAETAASHIEAAIWREWKTSDDFPLVEAVNSLDDMSEKLHDVVRDSLTRLNDVVGVAAPVNVAGADVAATLLTKPVTKPIEDLTHGLEVIGIFFGLVTGLHPLALICAKYLVHDEIGSALASAVGKLVEALTTVEPHRAKTAPYLAKVSEPTEQHVEPGLASGIADDPLGLMWPGEQVTSSDSTDWLEWLRESQDQDNVISLEDGNEATDPPESGLDPY